MNYVDKRLYIATKILSGICSGDWKFDIPNGMKWDEVACIRALELADNLISMETSISVSTKNVKPKKTSKGELQ